MIQTCPACHFADDVTYDLLSCVRPVDPWLEYGVVEHRYRTLRPQTYATLVRTYSHAARNAARGGTIATPDRSMTTSRRLSGALSQLAEDGLLSSRKGRASGFQGS